MLTTEPATHQTVPALPRGTYDHIRCGCCGVPLTDHDPSCARHEYVAADRERKVAEMVAEVVKDGEA